MFLFTDIHLGVIFTLENIGVEMIQYVIVLKDILYLYSRVHCIINIQNKSLVGNPL